MVLSRCTDFCENKTKIAEWIWNLFFFFLRGRVGKLQELSEHVVSIAMPYSCCYV